VSFVGANGTLDLTNPAAFTGTITGLTVDATYNTASNQIDFGGRIIESASLSGTTLTVVDSNNQSYALTLAAAPAAGTVVNLTTDGKGGTDAFLSVPAATNTFTMHSTSATDSWSDSGQWSGGLPSSTTPGGRHQSCIY
jgi:hypothetical protein